MAKKDNLNLDFEEFQDGIAEPSTVTDEELEKLTRPEIQPLGLNIAIRYGNKYLLKDLAFLSDSEMHLWVQQVLPVVIEEQWKDEDFRSRNVKAQTFDQILKFWSTPRFPQTTSLVEKTKKDKE